MKIKAKLLSSFSLQKSKTNKFLFFINDFCLDDTLKKRLKKNNIKFDIQKNFYNDVQNNFKQFQYCNKLYEKILNELTIKLNNLHKENWTQKSWEILIGPWLNRYIAVINDRLNHIIEAKKKYNITSKYTHREVALTSKSMIDFTLNCLSHRWNQKLLNRLINLHDTKNFKLNYLTKYKIKLIKPSSKKFKNRFIDFIKNKTNFFLNIFYKLNINHSVLNRTYVGRTFENMRLFLSLKEIPLKFFYQEIDYENVYKKDDRKKIQIFQNSKDLKERVIRYLLPEMIPIFYIENFRTLKANLNLQNLPSKKIMIYTRNLWKDDIFKFWVANQINNRSKLVYGQHGAGYGLLKGFFGDYFETRISDIFLTWGHSYQKLNKKVAKIIRCTTPFSVDYKNSLVNKSKINNNKKILIIPGVGNIFLTRNELFNYPTQENNNLLDFVKNLHKTLSKEIVVKPHPLDKIKSFSFSKSLKQKNNKIEILEPKTDLNKLIISSKISIFTSISTEFYKNLSKNIPSIFIIQNFYKKTFNKKALNHFNKLKQSNIVFYEGESAAKFLNNNYENIEKWWLSNKTQKAIKYFNKEFINTSNNPFKKIIHTLKKTKNEIININEKY